MINQENKEPISQIAVLNLNKKLQVNFKRKKLSE
jgi:hypothetical protein